MTWSAVLYYPWMQVRDPGWLRSAVLFWDTVFTMVPNGFDAGVADDERALADEGWLQPLPIAKHDPCVERASAGTLEMIRKIDVRLRQDRPAAIDHGADGFGLLLEEIERGKYTVNLERELVRRGLLVHSPTGGWPSVSRSVFDLHMTHLAHLLALDRNLALVTDEHGLTPFTDSLTVRRSLPASGRAGALTMPVNTVAGYYDGYDHQRVTAGTLSRYVLGVAGIDADTPIREVIRFRHRHADELALFRQALNDLAGEVPANHPGKQAFEQAVRDVFLNKVLPAVGELERAKRGGRLKLIPNLISASLLSSAPTWFGPLDSFLTPTGKILAIATGAGFSLTSVAVKHGVDARQLVGSSPYAFVLAARKEFGDGPQWHARQRWWNAARARRPY
jgi:hypothetical protein